VDTRVLSWGTSSWDSPTSSADFKNEWSCTSASALCLYGMDRDSFTFFTITFNRQIIIHNEIWLLLLKSFSTDETIMIHWERTHCSLWKEPTGSAFWNVSSDIMSISRWRTAKNTMCGPHCCHMIMYYLHGSITSVWSYNMAFLTYCEMFHHMDFTVVTWT